MSQGQGRGKETANACKSMSKALYLLNKDIKNYSISRSQTLQDKHLQTHKTQNMTTLKITQKHTTPLKSSLEKSFVQHISPASKLSAQRRQTSSCLPSSSKQSFIKNIHPSSKPPSQHKQTSSCSLSLSKQSYTQNTHPPSKSPSQYNQTPRPSNHQSPARQEKRSKDEGTSRDIMPSLK